MNKINKMALLLILSIFAITYNIQAGLLEYGSYGTPALCYNSTGLALNVKGVALAGQGLLANPALMAASDGLNAQISTGINWRREYRSIEVFDSYANSVGLRTTAINDQTDYNLNSAEVSYSTAFWMLPKVALGFGIAREYDFSYRYKLEERDAFYYLTSTTELTGEGAIYGYTGALAFRPLSFLSFGIGLSRLSGQPKQEAMKYYTDQTYTDQEIIYKSDFSGNRFSTGVLGRINPRINLGLIWKSSARIEGISTYSLNDSSISQTRKVGLPSNFIIGINYRPTNEFPATVNLEYEYTPWQNLDDNLYNTDFLAAVNKFSFGISHRMRNGLPLRFGVSFANSYLSSSIGLARAGFGTEISVSRVRAGISAGVGRRTYNYGQAVNTGDATTITETFADLMLTFTLK